MSTAEALTLDELAARAAAAADRPGALHIVTELEVVVARLHFEVLPSLRGELRQEAEEAAKYVDALVLIAQNLSLALSAAHFQGIAHGVAALLLLPHERARVADLELARRALAADVRGFGAMGAFLPRDREHLQRFVEVSELMLGALATLRDPHGERETLVPVRELSRLLPEWAADLMPTAWRLLNDEGLVISFPHYQHPGVVMVGLSMRGHLMMVRRANDTPRVAGAELAAGGP